MRKPLKIAMLLEAFVFFRNLLRYNASVNTDSDLQKMQYTLLRENHVIEKGMSMRNPRVGFGQAKVTALINRLYKYIDLYYKKDPQFLIYPLSTVKTYIYYTKEKGTSIPQIENLFNGLLERTNLADKLKVQGGIISLKKEDVINIIPANFEQFIASRHSIRYFSKEEPNEDCVRKALEIAQHTPSACNRQAWMVHLFYGDESLRLLKWQNGANGFENEIPLSILVTANQKAFLSHEPHQVYVDGGFYAMSLIYALQSQKLGTIPLSCGFDYNKLIKLNSDFEIPRNEVPIVIIGVGCLLDEFNIAVSTRKNITQTTVRHN